MADHYLEFSETLTHLTDEQIDWLQNQLETVHVIDGVEYTEDKLPDTGDAGDGAWIGCRAYRDMEDYDAGFGEDVGFDYSFHENDNENTGRHLWIHSEEHGYVDRVAHLVQKFLREFRPDACWSLTYAGTCSKPRVGEFGGGAVFVTATDIKYCNAWGFVEEQEKRHGLQKDIARLVDTANKLGLQPEDLDEAVHDAAGSLAASIDNAGLDEQVSWLVDQLGIGDVETCIKTIADRKAQEGPNHNTTGDD